MAVLETCSLMGQQAVQWPPYELCIDKLLPGTSVGKTYFFLPTPPIFPFFAVALLLLSGSFRFPVVLCLVVTAPKKDSNLPAFS